MSCPPVTLGDLVLDGATPDPNGAIWHVTRLDGWWDTSGMRSATAEAQPVGSIITVARENGRAITLEATATSETPNTLALGEDNCFFAIETMKEAARAVLVPVLLLVNDPALAGQAYVRRVGPIHQAINGRMVTVHFQVPLLAPDPRRYSQATFDTTITVANGLSTVTSPVATGSDVNGPFVWLCKGPANTPRLTSLSLGTHPFLEVGVNLANAADHLTVDMGAGTILHNGVDVSSLVSPGSQLFELLPGINSIKASRVGTTGDSDNIITARYAFD